VCVSVYTVCACVCEQLGQLAASQEENWRCVCMYIYSKRASERERERKTEREREREKERERERESARVGRGGA
jgi:hypothetical protein